MGVLLHDHVADQRKIKQVAHLTENLHEEILGANRAQKRQAAVKTECDEIKMAAPTAANEFVGTCIQHHIEL